jgi:dolichol-phosphate mannosyltransferase
MISVVSPIYNSEKCLRELVQKISLYGNKVTNKLEIILIDDGSQDNSWGQIVELKKEYNFIKGIKLNKNYGQHRAIFEGIKLSTKKIIIVMDCDLQDNPAYIVDMYKSYIKYKKPIIINHSYKNFELKNRILSNIFWYCLSTISFKKFSPNLGNYLLIDDKIKKNIYQCQELDIYMVT